MLTVTKKHTFELPIDELWDILGDFGNTGKWSGRPSEACVHEGKGIGSIRTLTISDGRVVIDKLEAQTDYSYSYSLLSGPLPYSTYRATMAVHAIDNARTEFSWTGEFEMTEMSDDEGVAFTENVYTMGIDMMKATISKL